MLGEANGGIYLLEDGSLKSRVPGSDPTCSESLLYFPKSFEKTCSLANSESFGPVL